ncbi:hypothetical protein [Oleiphilus sp. HI0123]|uniref:hypothetical protein n=1 Tax=Oleiphilus sp. HI0123 TaxID=1822265 RepID=UPI0007C3CC91|nr:hypothetical protein [Oleiphilus sp. HI0123]KZZ58122.1 hypothetical protein A3761_24355 [Oleiphilus sp. HI0123]
MTLARGGAVGCQSRKQVRLVEFMNGERFGDRLVREIKGNAGGHHMGGNIAGGVMEIGKQRKPVDWCAGVLEARDRTKGGVTAQPNGLFLTHVDYPSHFGVPVSQGAPSIIRSMIASASGSMDNDADLWRISHRLD